MKVSIREMIRSSFDDSNKYFGELRIPDKARQSAIIDSSECLEVLDRAFDAISVKYDVDDITLDVTISIAFKSGVVWFDRDKNLETFLNQADEFCLGQNPDGDGFLMTFTFSDIWTRRSWSKEKMLGGE